MNLPAALPIDVTRCRCGPCKLLANHMSKLEPEYAGIVRFEKVDTCKNYELAKRYKITKLPTLLLFQGAEQVGSLQRRLRLSGGGHQGCQGAPGRGSALCCLWPSTAVAQRCAPDLCPPCLARLQVDRVEGVLSAQDLDLRLRSKLHLH